MEAAEKKNSPDSSWIAAESMNLDTNMARHAHNNITSTLNVHASTTKNATGAEFRKRDIHGRVRTESSKAERPNEGYNRARGGGQRVTH